jgi:hypothetical protein
MKASGAASGPNRCSKGTSAASVAAMVLATATFQTPGVGSKYCGMAYIAPKALLHQAVKLTARSRLATFAG